ncbi:Serine aminopeptidase, S33 [Microbulbifer yueqingensis]|uniref:Serine aminopeptidase, S33 n=2 Tax=Microbulbifer yueqingensis TaxID=658219 RepID=A0A1G9APS6_9GAMM|nr:Serine aminopeptidase, S33 [Microbulbifer yueqingensis]
MGALLALLVLLSLYVKRLPDLQVWHTAVLDAEYTRESPVTSFAEYLALEDRLFAQLDREVYAQTRPAGAFSINRYRRGSLADPARWPTNWNRSFLLQAENARAAVLLLHGLTDAPYSLRHLGHRLHRAGATVLGLRIPGHGTVPSGLVDVDWQDMAAAVQLAMHQLSASVGGRPIHIVGYSNGAALAVHYALAALDDARLPPVQSLVLLSPEIGVARVAALAVWQARLGRLLGIEKLEWDSVKLLEYEPFKYGSFAVNGGTLTHELTRQIQRRLGELAKGDGLQDMPRVLSFSSVVDATVQAPAVISHLFNLLPADGNELVLFDINRQAEVEHLLTWDPGKMIDALRQVPQRRYALTLVTNADPAAPQVVARQWLPGQGRARELPVGLQWPAGVYSLSHVALPFSPEDPVYGGDPDPGPGIQLGNLALRGERGVLAISAATQLRLRWNPFYDWLENRTVQFMGLE